MTLTTSRASFALLARLMDLVRLQFRDEAQTIAVPAHGSPLGAGHLALLDGEALLDAADAGRVQALLELSKLVDCVQDGTNIFRGPEQSPGFVSERFQEIVPNVVFAPAPVDPEQQQRYARALALLYVEAPFVKTADYERFCQLRSDVEQKELSRLELRRQAEVASTDLERTLLVEQAEALEDLIAEGRDVLDALDRQHAFAAAELTKARVEAAVTRIPESVVASLRSFDLLRITAPDSNESHVQCSLMPAALSEENWVAVKITREELLAASPDDTPSIAPAPMALSTLDSEAIASLELEVQFLAVQRPWFWGELFDRQDWTWQTPADPVSEGMPGCRGLIPAYVSGLLVGRHLIVRSTRLGDRGEVGRARASRSPVRGGLAVGSPRVHPEAAAHRRVIAIRGAVTDERGQPVSNATAILRADRSPVRVERRRDVQDHRGQRTTTDGRGAFAFRALAGVSYALSVVRSGFTTVRSRIRPIRPVTVVPVRLRSEQASWPALTVRVRPRANHEDFDTTSEVRISSVSGGLSYSQRLSGAGDVTLRLPRGRYRVEVAAPDAQQVTPPLRVVEMASTAVVADVVIDSGFLLRDPDLQLVGFICRQVPLSPKPDAVGRTERARRRLSDGRGEVGCASSCAGTKRFEDFAQ